MSVRLAQRARGLVLGKRQCTEPRVKKKTAQRENVRSRLQFGVGEFQGLWELVASVGTCSRIGCIAHPV